MFAKKPALAAKDYRPPAGLLRERVILVTGAGSGLGQAAALSFAKAGAEVVLVGRQRHTLQETARKIEQANGAPATVAPLDLRSTASADYTSMGATLLERFGRLDGLLHNASVLGQLEPISSSNVATWFGVIQVNLHGAYLLTRELLPLLERSQDASIVFTSSGVGRKGRAYWGAYSVSKFGVEGLMQVLADELARTSNIRVNSINPGAVNTAMRRSAFPAEPPESNPSPDAVMNAYLYLMGKDSRALNGQALQAQ